METIKTAYATTVNAKQVTIKLDDRLPFGILRDAVNQNGFIEKVLDGKTDKEEIKFDANKWLETMLEAVIIEPVECKKVNVLYNCFTLEDIGKIMRFVDKHYSANKVVSAFAQGFGLAKKDPNLEQPLKEQA